MYYIGMAIRTHRYGARAVTGRSGMRKGGRHEGYRSDSVRYTVESALTKPHLVVKSALNAEGYTVIHEGSQGTPIDFVVDPGKTDSKGVPVAEFWLVHVMHVESASKVTAEMLSPNSRYHAPIMRASMELPPTVFSGARFRPMTISVPTRLSEDYDPGEDLASALHPFLEDV